MMIFRHRSLRFALLLAALAPCAHAMDDPDGIADPEQEYWAQVENRDWDQAMLAAERLVEATRVTSSANPEALAEALTLLGNAQLATRNLLGAESAFAESLQILQPRVAPTSEKLLEPLRGMGITLAQAGKHEQAVPYMERALSVSRRTHGLFNLNQQGILRQLAASLAKIGQLVQAEQQMQYLVRVGEQTYGAKDPRMAVIHDQLGDFYMQAGFAGAARQSYRDALQLVERKLGRNDLATVPPLRAYADSFRREFYLAQYGIRGLGERPSQVTDHHVESDGRAINPRYLNNDGERALKRAIKTLDSDPVRPTWLLLDTLLDLGDWYMIKGESKQALVQYRRAASLLDQVEIEHGVAARAKVSFPVQVYYPVPSAATRLLNRPPQDVEERFVQVTFTVDADGSVRDEHVEEANASPRQVGDTLDAIRGARYRPKFVNGEPVATRDVSLRQIFRLRRERDTE